MQNITKYFDKFLASKWQPILFIIIIGVLLYIPTLGYDYHYLDDQALIKNNWHNIENLSYIEKAFQGSVFPGGNGIGPYYRPLLTISFIIDAQFSNGSLIPFHVTNILLHLISSLLIFFTLLGLNIKKRLAFIFSLLFIIHPINLHAVAWIPGRNDSLLTVFFLGAFLSFLNFLKSKKIWHYLLYIILFTLSLLTKETALALPILTFLYLYFIHKENLFSKFSIINFLIIVATTSYWYFIRSAAMGKLISDDYNVLQSLFQNITAIFPYLGKTIFTHNLSVFPVMPDLPLIYGILVLGGIITLLYLSKEKKWSYIIFGTLWFLGTLAPSMIKTVSTQIQIVEFADHRTYLALFGLILVLSQIKIPLNNIRIKKYLPQLSLIVIIIIFSLFTTKTIIHSKVYENKITFWNNAAEYSPSSAFNFNNLGAMYYMDGKYNLSEQNWLKALEINPNEKLVHNNLGLLYAMRNENDKAYKYYMKELELNPNYANGTFNLGLLLYKTRKVDEAIKAWKKTIEINIDYFNAYEQLAEHYYRTNNLDQARFYINEILKHNGPIDQIFLDKLK